LDQSVVNSGPLLYDKISFQGKDRTPLGRRFATGGAPIAQASHLATRCIPRSQRWRTGVGGERVSSLSLLKIAAGILYAWMSRMQEQFARAGDGQTAMVE